MLISFSGKQINRLLKTMSVLYILYAYDIYINLYKICMYVHLFHRSELQTAIPPIGGIIKLKEL